MNNNATPLKLTRIPSLKTVEDFRAHVASLGIALPCEDAIVPGSASPLVQPVEAVTINGKRIGNRWAIHPMEGWDGTVTGGVTDDVRRRWQRFGESGAKLIYGGEAMAVRPDGRANPNQLIIIEENKGDLASLREDLVKVHRERYGTADDLLIGFQLTHSGRFCKPTDKKRLEPRVAFRHPILDRKFNVTSDDQVFSDGEIEELIQCYIRAAKIAWDVGADFVDIKHCHGYLLHEFLGAHTRPGKFGGSFENRTRILREIIAGIRASGNRIELGVRLSAFDFIPFKPDPSRSQPGKLGPGIPEDFSRCLPYRYGFGVNPGNPVEPELTEPIEFVRLCAELGVKIVNLSAGSPYYNPHIQRPAAYPPSDGYQPPEDPLAGVARQINAVRQIKAHLTKHQTPNTKHQTPVLVGTAYSYLQEYLPHVAQYVIRNGWTDMIGIGRMVLSYPEILADAVAKGSLTTKSICRTFSDCTTAPRNGMISGCYPLDKYYNAKPEYQQLKEVKKTVGG
ncbi:MAG: NADH:flavin oxidoreductase [Verrucomicrobiae bacterium]|nr:NADH:flavin oxidoreductase [Verrucomicrobiae bacterium]